MMKDAEMSLKKGTRSRIWVKKKDYHHGRKKKDNNNTVKKMNWRINQK